jgi:hypothetical protein
MSWRKLHHNWIRRRALPLAGILGAAIVFAPCTDEQPTAPLEAGGVLASEGTGSTPVNVTVIRPDGTPVGPGVRVTLLDTRFEPLIASTESNGVAPFEVRADLRFCVYASPVFNEGERWNPSGTAYDEGSGFVIHKPVAAAIMRDLRQPVAANRTTFNHFCVQNPTHDASGGNFRNRDIVLQLVAASHIGGTILDLTGGRTSGPTLLSQSLLGLDLPSAWIPEETPSGHYEPVLGLAWAKFGGGETLPVAPGLGFLKLTTELLKGSPLKWGESAEFSAPSQAGDTGSQEVETEANFCTYVEEDHHTHMSAVIDPNRLHFDEGAGVRGGWLAGEAFEVTNTFALTYVVVVPGQGGEWTTKTRSGDGSFQVTHRCTTSTSTCEVVAESGSYDAQGHSVVYRLENGHVRVYEFFELATSDAIDVQLEAEEISRRLGPNHKVPGTSRDLYPQGWLVFTKATVCEPLDWTNTTRLIF